MRPILLALLLGCQGAPDADPSAPRAPRDLDGDGYISILDGGDDCNDADPSIHPGAPEVCNGVDDDCDGEIDEGVRLTYAVDADGDGWGDTVGAVQGCSVPPGYTEQLGDCDDGDATVHPGATEVCSGKDDDCDGVVDNAADLPTWYRDADGDGWGDAAHTVDACEAPPGYVARAGDCDDARADVYPGAPEICGEDVDANCDGASGFVDNDGDGFPACEDCNDFDAAIHPGAPEVCDGVDNDCDGIVDEGFDQDGDGFTTCAGDCDDADPAVYPGAPEIPYDGVDQDCDGSDLVDVDGDGYAALVAGGEDCDDEDPAVHPGVAIDVYNGVDDDCDGQVDEGPYTATYVANVQPIWGLHCLGGCHGYGKAEGLDLRNPSYGRMVGVPSVQLPAMDLVRPLSLGQSYLWHKLADTHLTVGGSGVFMPKDDPYLTPDEMATVSAWILEGCPP